MKVPREQQGHCGGSLPSSVSLHRCVRVRRQGNNGCQVNLLHETIQSITKFLLSLSKSSVAPGDAMGRGGCVCVVGRG